MEVETTSAVLGLLLSFILHDFALDSIFKSLKDTNIDDIDEVIAKYEPHLQFIHHPGALPLLWTLHQRVWTCPSIRYGFSKILGRLASASHRNLVVMSNAGLAIPIFEHFCSSKGDKSVPEKERHAWQKLLRRLLELGSEPAHARAILQKAVQQGDILDPEMLDLIRYGMKSRWVDHFSMESPSALVVTNEDTRGLPASGITFMVGSGSVHRTVMPGKLKSVSLGLDLPRSPPYSGSSDTL